MAGQPNVQERLREGIDAAKRGDKVTARRLLQQVLIVDRDNEVALTWMASVVESLSERRAFLEKVLRVNPNNSLARAALQKMGVAVADAPGGGTGSPSGALPNDPAGRTTAQRGSPYLLAAGIVALMTALVVVVTALNNRTPPVSVGEATIAALIQPSATATLGTVLPPTETTFFGVLVTLDPNQNPQPATFTPTDTPEPTLTPLPTDTPFPPAEYAVYAAQNQPDFAQPALFSATGDGERVDLIGSTSSGFADVTFNRRGDEIAFVRYIEGTPINLDSGEDDSTDAEIGEGDSTDAESTPDATSGGGIPQLFVASVATLNDARQVTELNGSRLSSPSWSPDGSTLIFSSNIDGDDELWTINADGTGLTQITANGSADLTPDYASDGSAVVFASDRDSPGLLEIYELDLETQNVVRLTDEAGSNYSPSYAPDGTRITFISDQNGDGDLYIMDRSGQRKFLLTIDDADAEDRSPTWTPDGEYIAFASNRASDDFAWYLYRLLDGEVVPMLTGNGSAQSITFIPLPSFPTPESP